MSKKIYCTIVPAATGRRTGAAESDDFFGKIDTLTVDVL